MPDRAPLLVATAHPGGFAGRAAGAIAMATAAGQRAVIACLSFGERGESARLWRHGYGLDQVKAVRHAEKAVRHAEGEKAAAVPGVEIECSDAGDGPRTATPRPISGCTRRFTDVLSWPSPRLPPSPDSGHPSDAHEKEGALVTAPPSPAPLRSSLAYAHCVPLPARSAVNSPPARSAARNTSEEPS